MNHEELIDTMYAIYSEDDESRRNELLDKAIDDDIEFYGLQGELFGRNDFNQSFRNGGTRLVRTSPVEHRSGWLRCTWELCEADGSVVMDGNGRPYAGVQISRIGADGRLQLIVPFQGLDL